MANKRIILVGDGFFIGMLKFCLMDDDQIELIEVTTEGYGRLIEFIECEKTTFHRQRAVTEYPGVL